MKEFKIKLKKESSKANIQCYKCKGYGHMMYGCPSKEKDLDPKGKKVLQTTLDLDDEDSDFIRKFCTMTI